MRPSNSFRRTMQKTGVSLGSEQRRLSIRHIAATAFGAAIFVLAFCVIQTTPTTVDVVNDALVVDGIERTFRVVVPQSVTTKAPVVFAYHGIGDSPEAMAAYSQLDQLAADEGILLIYPAGINAMWAAFDVAPNSLDENPDVRFFDALLRHVNANYSINLARVYLVGMSNGASFVHVLANARPDTIAGVVAHSGPRPRALGKFRGEFPVLLVVGGDDLSLTSIQSDLNDYRTAGQPVKLIVVEGAGHSWSVHSNSTAWEFVKSQ